MVVFMVLNIIITMAFDIRWWSEPCGSVLFFETYHVPVLCKPAFPFRAPRQWEALIIFGYICFIHAPESGQPSSTGWFLSWLHSPPEMSVKHRIYHHSSNKVGICGGLSASAPTALKVIMMPIPDPAIHPHPAYDLSRVRPSHSFFLLRDRRLMECSWVL